MSHNTINSSISQNTQDIPINNSTNHRGIVHFCHFPLSHSVSSPPQYSHKKRRPRDGKRRHLEVQLLEAPAISQRVKLDITGASSNWTNNVEKCFLCQHCAHEQLCCFARTRVNSKKRSTRFPSICCTYSAPFYFRLLAEHVWCTDRNLVNHYLKWTVHVT